MRGKERERHRERNRKRANKEKFGWRENQVMYDKGMSLIQNVHAMWTDTYTHKFSSTA